MSVIVCEVSVCDCVSMCVSVSMFEVFVIVYDCISMCVSEIVRCLCV